MKKKEIMLAYFAALAVDLAFGQAAPPAPPVAPPNIPGAPAPAAQPPLDPVIQELDPACVEYYAAQCFEAAYPATFQSKDQHGAAFNCPEGYKIPAFGSSTCVRLPLTQWIDKTSPAGAPERVFAAMSACEVDARVHYNQTCLRPVPVSQMLSILGADMRKLLQDFCATYAKDASSCQSLYAPPTGGQ